MKKSTSQPETNNTFPLIQDFLIGGRIANLYMNTLHPNDVTYTLKWRDTGETIQHKMSVFEVFNQIHQLLVDLATDDETVLITMLERLGEGRHTTEEGGSYYPTGFSSVDIINEEAQMTQKGRIRIFFNNHRLYSITTAGS